jgi:hypothetical protein
VALHRRHLARPYCTKCPYGAMQPFCATTSQRASKQKGPPDSNEQAP